VEEKKEGRNWKELEPNIINERIECRTLTINPHHCLHFSPANFEEELDIIES
jgi:hypothetical protein